MFPYLASGFWCFRNSLTMRGREKHAAPQKTSAAFRARWAYFTRMWGSPNYRISPNVKDIRRKWANFCLLPKIWGPLRIPPIRKRVLAHRVGNSAWICLRTGSRQTAQMGQFRPKFLGPLRIPPIRKRVLAPLGGKFRMGLPKDGKSPSMNNLPTIMWTA